MHTTRITIAVLGGIVIATAGCGRSQSIEPTQLSAQEQAAITATPPPAVSTPVPIVHAKSIPGSGRQDPFVPLYGPVQSASTPSKPQRTVGVSTFPNIPTLPGFEGSANPGRPPSIWDSVRLTGIVKMGGFSAIVQANGQSYIVRPGDLVAGTFRVVAIGPDFVTLATSKEQRRITLGG